MRIVDENGFLCGTCLDVTLYLSEAPTANDARTALSAYRRVCPASGMRMVSGPDEDWSELQGPLRDADVEPYFARMDERIDEGIWVWDGVEDGWSFLIRGVPPQEPENTDEADEEETTDDEPAPQEDVYTEDEPDEPDVLIDVASLCQVQLPETASVDTVLEVTRQLADILPFVSGHGGLAFSYDPWRKDEAFDQIYAWAKRFWGIDVHDLNRTLPYALTAAKGVNWLTLIGNELWASVTRAHGGQEPHFGPGVLVEKGRHGALIRAGDRPQLADRNKREFPHLYAAVERQLMPVLMGHHSEFAGRFSETKATLAWLRRFSDPAAWAGA